MKLRRAHTLFTTLLVAITAMTAWAADLPKWQPAEEDLKRLDRPVTEKVFTAKTPSTYLRQVRRGPDGLELLGWVGPIRQDRTQNYLMYAFIPLSDEDKNKDSLESQLEKLLAGVESRRSKWTRTETELGEINGTTYARAYWKGTDRITGQKMAGFYYVTRIKGGLMSVSSQDILDYEATDLRFIESAALTTTLRN